MSAAARGRRAAHRADRMHAQKTGERTGSRPKPPEAGARSASLEPGRAPGYSDHHSCSLALRHRRGREYRSPSILLTRGTRPMPLSTAVIAYESEEAARRRLMALGYAPDVAHEIAVYLAQSTDLPE